MGHTSNSRRATKILIVEDDADSREILTRIFHRAYPYVTVYTAINGKEGLDLFTRHIPDIVITDLNMKEMGGAEMGARILEIKRDSKIIVITALSGKTELKCAVGNEFEADHYVFKPVNFKILFDAMNQCIVDINSKSDP